MSTLRPLLSAIALAIAVSSPGQAPRGADLARSMAADRAALRADPQKLEVWLDGVETMAEDVGHHRVRVVAGLGGGARSAVPRLIELLDAPSHLSQPATNALSGIVDHVGEKQQQAILMALASSQAGAPSTMRGRMVARAFERAALPPGADLEAIRAALQSRQPARIEAALLRLRHRDVTAVRELLAELEDLRALESITLDATYRLPDGTTLRIADPQNAVPRLHRELATLVGMALMDRPISLPEHLARVVDGQASPVARADSVRAIGEFAVANRETVLALARAAAIDDPLLQREVAVALGLMIHQRPALGDNRVIRRLLDQLAASQAPRVAAAAHRVLEQAR